MSPPASQEQEETLPKELARDESSNRLTEETEKVAPEGDEPANDANAEAMEVAPSEAASTVGDLMPAHSQDAVIVHAPEEEQGLD